MTRDSSPRLAHLRSLDGLRGVAVLAVVIYHFSPSILPGGFLGVDVFFVLSGFLITSLLVKEWGTERRVALPRFWSRRARRLLPALLLLLTVVGIVVSFDPDQVGGRRIAHDGLAAFTYLANWHFIDVGQAYIEQFLPREPSPLRHVWSLAIEEQFYLVWPLVVAGLGALVAKIKVGRHGRKRELRYAVGSVSLVLAGVSLALMLSLYDNGDLNRVYYGTDTRAHLLLIGATLGAFTAGAPAITRPARRRLVVALGSVCAIGLVALMATLTPSDLWLYQGGYAAIAIAISVILVAAAQAGANPLAALLETRAIVGLGLISYGVYLWHWPMTVWLTESSTGTDGPALFALRAGATMAASVASYFLVEQPIRRGRYWRPRIARPRVVAATLIGVVGVLLLVPALALPKFVEAPRAEASSAEEAAGYVGAPRCDGPRVASSSRLDAAGLRVQLVGNSIAEEVAPCLRTILRARSGSLRVIVEDGPQSCELYPRVRRQLRGTHRPNVAILFMFPLDCNDATWDVKVTQAVSMWKEAGVRVFLVPILTTVRRAEWNVAPFEGQDTYWAKLENDALRSHALYTSLAQRDPAHVAVLDAGMFLRDGTGVSQWRVACLPQGELGCEPDGAITVRNPTDAAHLCADPAWVGDECPATFQGGPRRAAAAIAGQLLGLLPPKQVTTGRENPSVGEVSQTGG